MADKHVDEISGVETTGHEWDGIRELNNPLPRWWLWTFYVTILWAIGYWIAMPAWPLISSYTRGVLDHSQRANVAEELAAADAQRQEFASKLADASLERIRTEPELLNFALAGGESAFKVNCSQCHGTGAAGGVGYPNLNDDDWLWGGKLDDIEHTIRYGIRSAHEETRTNEMPAFGRDQLLGADEISAVTDYVLSLSGGAAEGADLETGKTVFVEQCAACHMEDGKGSYELGAPDLTDGIWLYGGDRADVIATIRNSRGGVMPAWQGRLDSATIKQLAIYVHSLGGGE